MDSQRFTSHRKELLQKITILDKRIASLRKESKRFSEELKAWDNALTLGDVTLEG